MVNGWLMEFFSVFSKFTYKWTTQTNLARLARPFRGRKHHFFPIIAVFQDFQTIQRLQNYLRGCPSISFNIATFLYIDSTTMSVWRPLFIKCIILDHKLQRMLNDSKIGQLHSERPLHQTAVKCHVIETFPDLNSTKQAQPHPTSYNEEVLFFIYSKDTVVFSTS